MSSDFISKFGFWKKKVTKLQCAENSYYRGNSMIAIFPQLRGAGQVFEA